MTTRQSTRSTAHGAPPESDPHQPGAERANSGARHMPESSAHATAPGGSDGGHGADGMAVASFVAGLTGLLVCNVVLGPCALVLGGLALARRTARRGRALLGMVLGVADLVVLAVLVTVNGTVSWSVGG